MSRKRGQKVERRVQRMYEPDRLSIERLIDAYERLVARQIRIIKSPSETAKSQNQTKYHQEKGA